MGQQTQIFKLFISGMSAKSILAIENIKEIGEARLKGKFKFEIVDISKTPEKASEYQIVAVPTLIRINPEPRRMFIGDLKDKQKIIQILGI